MARKGLTGQLNMFDFYREWEAASPQAGEIEMVSLMPGDEPEAEAVKPEVAWEPVVEIVEPEVESEPVVEQHIEVIEQMMDDVPIEEVSDFEVAQEPVLVSIDSPVMHRTYTTPQGTIEIAYINYSKVRISEPGKSPQIKEFGTSKDAVDFYVDQMQRFEELYGIND